MSENKDNNQNGNQQDSGKEFKKQEGLFNKNIQSLVAIYGGEKNLGKPKVPKSEMENLMGELFKEDRELVEQEVKVGLRDLVKKRADFNKTIAEEEKKLQAVKLAKMKEFNQAANQLYLKIAGLSEIEKTYLDSLGEFKEAVISSDDESAHAKDEDKEKED